VLATLTREMQNLRGDVAALTSGGGNALNMVALNKYGALASSPGSTPAFEDFPRLYSLQALHGLEVSHILPNSLKAASSRGATGPTGPHRDSEQKEDERK
jgi:hypothetical protein